MGKNPQIKSSLLREFSSGGVVYDFDKKLWLLIQPKKTTRWQFPKGKIEKGESSEIAATREVFEESGIKAVILRKIGVNKYFFFFNGNRVFKSVSFFLMKFVSGNTKNHDNEVEKAEFFKFDDALANLTFKDDKQTLTKAMEMLEQDVNGNLL